MKDDLDGMPRKGTEWLGDTHLTRNASFRGGRRSCDHVQLFLGLKSRLMEENGHSQQEHTTVVEQGQRSTARYIRGP